MKLSHNQQNPKTQLQSEMKVAFQFGFQLVCFKTQDTRDQNLTLTHKTSTTPRQDCQKFI